MTSKSHRQQTEPEGTDMAEHPDTSDVTTRDDLRQRAPEPSSSEPVKLTSPTGTKVTVAADMADELRERGYT